MRLGICAGLVLVSGLGFGFAAGCIGSSELNQGSSGAGNGGSPARPSAESRTTPLERLPISTLTVDGQTIRVWLARTPEHQQEGLMHVPANEIADDQGMLFVFPDEALRFFWMRNTITPLDIAYARSDGTVVKTWQMPPLTLQNFPSIEPAMFALEMKAGSFARLGIHDGSRLVIPMDVFPSNP